MSGVTLDWEMHPGQLAIYKSPALYKVVRAGRRFGKTYMAAMVAIIEGLKAVDGQGRPLQTDSEVMYIAPTFDQGKAIFWPVLKLLAEPVTLSCHENTGVLTLVNGVRIRIKGMDNPDRARGFKLRYAILDEYADMPEGVWEAIIRPALADLDGGALFIGTPKGMNHFYDIWTAAAECVPAEDGSLDWEAFKFRSDDNPFTPRKSLDRMYDDDNYSSDLIAQELEADFIVGGGDLFKESDWVPTIKEPKDGYYVLTVDPAGFTNDKVTGKKVRRDDTAITVTKITRKGWWVATQESGKWDPREVALRIIKLASNWNVAKIGVEKGALMYAIMPYLEEVMRQYRKFFIVEALSHGNQQKTLRIQWSLQGRLERGRIMINCDPRAPKHKWPEWAQKLIMQASAFPSQQVHDDCIDSLSFVDQLAKTVFWDFASDDQRHLNEDYDTWEPLDKIAGY